MRCRCRRVKSRRSRRNSAKRCRWRASRSNPPTASCGVCLWHGRRQDRDARDAVDHARDSPIADLWTKAFGATRQQLIEMVKDGRVSTEDLMGALLKGSDAIQAKFEKLQERNAQTMERWIEDEKILSQRYGRGLWCRPWRAGRSRCTGVCGSRQRGRLEACREQAKLGGQLGELAAAALQKAHDQNKAAAADFANDLTNLSGPLPIDRRCVPEVDRRYGRGARRGAEAERAGRRGARRDGYPERRLRGRLDRRRHVQQALQRAADDDHHGIGSQAFKYWIRSGSPGPSSPSSTRRSGRRRRDAGAVPEGCHCAADDDPWRRDARGSEAQQSGP